MDAPLTFEARRARDLAYADNWEKARAQAMAEQLAGPPKDERDAARRKGFDADRAQCMRTAQARLAEQLDKPRLPAEAKTGPAWRCEAGCGGLYRCMKLRVGYERVYSFPEFVAAYPERHWGHYSGLAMLACPGCFLKCGSCCNGCTTRWLAVHGVCRMCLRPESK